MVVRCKYPIKMWALLLLSILKIVSCSWLKKYLTHEVGPLLNQQTQGARTRPAHVRAHMWDDFDCFCLEELCNLAVGWARAYFWDLQCGCYEIAISWIGGPHFDWSASGFTYARPYFDCSLYSNYLRRHVASLHDLLQEYVKLFGSFHSPLIFTFP